MTRWPSLTEVLLLSDNLKANDFAARADVVQQQVLRNLETLLNTRRHHISPPQHLACVHESLLAFGIPDFTGCGFDNDLQRRRLCGVIKAAIRNFEPRLRNVEVVDLNKSSPIERSLRFQITGQLLVYPRPYRVAFDSRLDRTTSIFTVQNG